MLRTEEDNLPAVGYGLSRLIIDDALRINSVVGGAVQVYYNRPALFYCSSLTRNEQALETVDAIKSEIVRLREKGVTETELAEARQSILNSFVFNYDSAAKIIGRQITYEMYGYPVDFADKLLSAMRYAFGGHLEKK